MMIDVKEKEGLILSPSSAANLVGSHPGGVKIRQWNSSYPAS